MYWIWLCFLANDSNNSQSNKFVFVHSADRYRQILEKALQFTDAEQLEALKAFVEASKYTNIQYDSLMI